MGLDLAARARIGPRAPSIPDRTGEFSANYDGPAVVPVSQVDYGSSKTVEYTLDALGNRGTEVQTIRPSTGSNVITTWSSTFDAFNELKTRNRSGGGLPAQNVTLAYDLNGNTLSETTASPAAVTTYTWDRDNRLRAVTPPAPGVRTSYSYDANGLRIERVDATGTTRYLLDGPSVLAELDGANSAVTHFLNNSQQLDEVVSFERSGATYWPLTDALGSAYAVADANGVVVHRYSFDVSGVRTDVGGGGPAIDVGYTGRWHDGDGLVDYRDRQRRADLGGWLQPDRMRMLDGPSLFLFVHGRPTLLTDPFGTRTEVLLSEPRGWLASSFGHIAVRINNTAYSFARDPDPNVPTDMEVAPLDQYLADNDEGDIVGVMIWLSPVEEMALAQSLISYGQTYQWGPISNNCVRAAGSALADIGLWVPGSVTPHDLFLDLLQYERALGMTYYPSHSNQSRPPGSPQKRVANALWGRSIWFDIVSFGSASN